MVGIILLTGKWADNVENDYTSYFAPRSRKKESNADDGLGPCCSSRVH